MGNPKVSVVMATYNRAHLLKRSLQCYANQDFRDIEVIVVDDWSEDDTPKLVRDWSSSLNVRSINPHPKEPGEWRDTSSVINHGLREAGGDLVLLTHPEVMVGVDTIRSMWEHRRYWIYHCAKVYYLTADNQAKLDTVAWEMDRLKVRELPDFYNDAPHIEGPASEYSHRKTDEHTTWESWVFGGMTRDTWQKYGPMTEFHQWGSVDVDFLNRRHAAGIRSLTELNPSTIVIHQNHDVEQGVFKTTPRDMDLALKDLPRYTPDIALKGPAWNE